MHDRPRTCSLAVVPVVAAAELCVRPTQIKLYNLQSTFPCNLPLQLERSRKSWTAATPADSRSGPCRAKFECATGELYNPIKQDTQHGKLRYYKHGDMMFNYGFFPQTWEDPDVILSVA